MSDLERVQGEWTLVGGERNGKAFSDSIIGKVKLTFAKDVLKTTKPGGVSESTFTLHPDTTPKGIDLDMDGSPGLGIYKLTGDTLTIVHGEIEQPRPRDFEAIKDGNLTMLILRGASR